MDEFERLNRLLDENAPPDPGAKERARARLQETIDREKAARARGRRPLRRHPVTWIGTAAAIALMVLVIEAVLPPNRGGPQISAATQLRRLGVVASNAPAPNVPPGS